MWWGGKDDWEKPVWQRWCLSLGEHHVKRPKERLFICQQPPCAPSARIGFGHGSGLLDMSIQWLNMLAQVLVHGMSCCGIAFQWLRQLCHQQFPADRPKYAKDFSTSDRLGNHSSNANGHKTRRSTRTAFAHKPSVHKLFRWHLAIVRPEVTPLCVSQWFFSWLALRKSMALPIQVVSRLYFWAGVSWCDLGSQQIFRGNAPGKISPQKTTAWMLRGHSGTLLRARGSQGWAQDFCKNQTAIFTGGPKGVVL